MDSRTTTHKSTPTTAQAAGVGDPTTTTASASSYPFQANTAMTTDGFKDNNEDAVTGTGTGTGTQQVSAATVPHSDYADNQQQTDDNTTADPVQDDGNDGAGGIEGEGEDKGQGQSGVKKFRNMLGKLGKSGGDAEEGEKEVVEGKRGGGAGKKA